MSNSGEDGEWNAGEEVTQHSATSINYLNYDCLAEIFKNLPLGQRLEIETVCKHWKEASQFAWNDRTAPDFSTDYSGASDDVKELPLILRNTKDLGRILMRCGPHLERLHIGTPFGCLILSIVAQHCSNLRELKLRFRHYDANWIQFLANMKRLESVEMTGSAQDFFQEFLDFVPHTLVKIFIFQWPNPPKKPNPFSATSAFRNLQHLRDLELYSCHLDQSMIDAISENPELTNLSLLNCRILGDITPLLHLKNLEDLSLGYVKALHYYDNVVNDNFVIRLADSCRKLRFLNLAYSFGITDHGFEGLQRLTQLEKLDCSYCPNVRDRGIIRLLNNAPKLEKLDVTRCNCVSEAVLVEALEVTRRRASLPLTISVDRDLDEETAEWAHSHLLTVDSYL